MCSGCAGTVIYSSRGDGTEWVYTINENGTRIGSMVSSEGLYNNEETG